MSKTAHEIAKELATGLHGSFCARLAQAWFVADSTNAEIIEKSFANVFRKIDSKFRTTEVWAVVYGYGTSEWCCTLRHSEAEGLGTFEWATRLRHCRCAALVRLDVANEHLSEYSETVTETLNDTENGFKTFASVAEKVWRKGDVQAAA